MTAGQQPTTTTADTIRVRCPACGATFRGKSAMIGMTGACPACKKPFKVQACEETGAQPHGSPGTASKPEPAAGDASPRSETLHFVGQAHQYCFAMPTAGWAKLRSEDAALLDADVAVVHPDIGYVMVAVDPWPMSFDDLKTTLDQSYQSKVDKFRLLKKTDTAVAGLPAVSMDFEGRYNRVLMHFAAHVFLFGSNAFHIIAMGDPVLFGRLRKEVAAALASFSFDPGRVSAAAAVEPTTRADVQLKRQASDDGSAKETAEGGKPRQNGPPAVLTLGRPRALMACNSCASVARDIAVHTGNSDGALRGIEIVSRWWFVLFLGQMWLGVWAGRGNGLVGLVFFFGAFAWPLMAYEWFPRILRDRLRRHLRKETGGVVPDPDISNEDPLHRLGSKPLGQLQLALNRHWEYHERQATARGIKFERVQWCGPLRDVFLPLGIVALGFWIAWQIFKWSR